MAGGASAQIWPLRNRSKAGEGTATRYAYRVCIARHKGHLASDGERSSKRRRLCDLPKNCLGTTSHPIREITCRGSCSTPQDPPPRLHGWGLLARPCFWRHNQETRTSKHRLYVSNFVNFNKAPAHCRLPGDRFDIVC